MKRTRKSTPGNSQPHRAHRKQSASYAPTGLSSSRVFTHGSRRGLPSYAPTGLASARDLRPRLAAFARNSVEPLEARLMLAADVIINEIMHHPINPATPGQAVLGEEYIELHNKGNQAANLTGWRFDRGVDFAFTGGSIPVGGYLVLAADRSAFLAKYPAVNPSIVVGPWTGRLSNSGEEIRLVDQLGGTVDAVTYADQGDWAVRRKGFYPTEAVQSITSNGTTATVTRVNHGFDIGDSVLISGASPAAYNGTFTVTGYTPNTFTYATTAAAGTASGTITVKQVTDNGHIGWSWVQAADGDGNSLELRNNALTNNQGQNWGSSSAPQGTPGAVNSINSSNIAPMILDLAHLPLIPRSTDSVTVTARVVDELGTAAGGVTLFFRNDGEAGFSSLAMRDDGTNGDLVANDDIWSGVLGPQPDNTIVEFYVRASDGGLVRTMPGPSDGGGTQGANALYQVDDTIYSGAAPIYRLVMTEAERAELADIGNPGNGSENSEHNTNAQMNATFIAMDGVNSELRYNAGARNRGHGSRDNVPNNYRLNLPSDKPYLGRTALNFNAQVAYNQIIGSAIWRLAGIAVGETAPVELRVNGTELLGTYALVEEKDGEFAQNHFPDDPQGNIYSAFRLDPNLVPEADLRYLGSNGASYVPLYPKGSNAEVNDYSDLINLTNVLNNAAAATYVEDVKEVINLDQWLRYFALDQLLLNRETGFVRGIGDDFSMYRGIVDPRFVLVPHDLDTILGTQATNINASIFSNIDGLPGDPQSGDGVDGVRRLLAHPDIVPMYYQAYLDLIQNIFNPTVLNPLIDQMLTGVATPAQITSMKNFIVNRTNAVLAQIPQQFQINTTLPITNGYPRTTTPNAVLTGRANTSKTRSVMVNGQLVNYDPRSGNWTTPTGGGGGTITLVQAGTQGTQGAPTSGPPCTVVGTPGAPGAVWKYLDNGSNQGTAWRTADFASLPWASGASQLGYNDCGDEVTPVLFIDADPVAAGIQKNITTYFRHDFTVADRSQIAGLTLRILRDDGAVVYLNGTRVNLGIGAGSAGNMPDIVTYTTPASAATNTETTFFTASVDPALLVDGVNELAVEIHQNVNTSSDISFDLGLEATLVGSGGMPLNPGINRVLVQAFDGFNGLGNEVNRGFVDIWFDGVNPTPVPQPAAPVSDLQLLMPDTYRAGNPILVQVKALNASGQIQRDLWNATVTLATDRGNIGLSSTQIVLRNGVGSVLVTPTGAGTGTFELIATLGDKQSSKTISPAPTAMTNVSGTLAGAATTWSGVIHVVGDVIVPVGHTLTIQPGTQVLIDGVASGTTGFDIEVQGRILANGTEASPVVITSFNPAHFWGELRHVNAQPSTYNYTLITRGGASPGAGHTGTGPTIRSANSTLTFNNSTISDTLGKIAHTTGGTNAQLTMIDSHMARARMGPETLGTGVLLDRTWITEMAGPDDADGIYLQSAGAGHTIELRNGVIAQFVDDGIDTLGSQVLIENYIVRDGNDKGISVYHGTTTIRNSILTDNAKLSEDGDAAQVSGKADNGQTTNVVIDHSTITGPTTAIQVSNKTAQATANIFYNVTNSIIRAPDSVKVDAPYDPARVVITYSNVGEAWPGVGNINVDPLYLDEAGKNYRLRPGSPSINAGNPAAANDPDGSRADQGYFLNGTPGTRAAQTIAAGTLAAGNTILSPEGGPYNVTGIVTVPTGATLIVLPGTSVFFNTGAGFNISGGRMLAEGTATNQIRFTRVPGSTTGPWNGLQFSNSNLDNRITYSVIEYGGTTANNGMVGVTNSRLLLDHNYFANTDRRRLRTNNASVILRNSEFADIFGPGVAPTTDNLSEHIWGSGIMPGGVFIVENNIFGTTKGHNDAIDWDTATLPGPIPQIINNIFMGGGDDALDLEADALIEGNTFMNFIKDVYNTGTGNSNIMSAGDATQLGHQYFFNRNTVFNVQHVVQVKENSFLTFENNTVVNGLLAAIYFFRPGQANSWGMGATLDGNIFVNTPTIFADFQPTTQITVNRSVVPASELSRGVGNTAGDARVRNPAAGDFSLRPGSVALGTGPNGTDMGAMVPAGASISGVPRARTWRNTATITVDGPGITHYRYKLDDGAWSAETPVATPISLGGLSNGNHAVHVIGKNIAGVWQPETDAAVSRTWLVDPAAPRVLVSEILAINSTTLQNGTTFPDLIELYNDSDAPINLLDMSITDNPLSPRKYVFGNVTISPGEYLILYADSRTVAGEIHTGFALDADGEKVSLFDTLANGGGLLDGVAFGPQLVDLSIGQMSDGSWRLNQPTFGAANVAKLTGDASTLKINEWLTDGVTPIANDFIELYNPDSLPVHLGGLYLTDKPTPQPLKFQIPELSFAPAGGFTVFTADDDVAAGPDHTNFRLAHLNGMIGLNDADGEKIDRLVYGPQRTSISQGRNPDGASSMAFFSPPNPGLTNVTGGASASPLRITEMNFNAPGAGEIPGDEYEFIELTNTGTTSINLNGMRFSAGVFFIFGNVDLAAGATIVVAKNPSAFTARYGTGINVVGPFTDSLDNNGEEIRLLDAASLVIHDFVYSDTWQPTADGDGHTLTIINPSAAIATWNTPAAWKASKHVLGTPGIGEHALAAGAVVINEVNSNAPAGGSWIELRNTSGAAVNIGGWYLTDSLGNTRKFRIPAGTTIGVGANSYLAFTEGTLGFALSRLGGDAFLSSSTTADVLTGYHDGVSFGASDAGVTLGRHVLSTGVADFTALSSPTQETANSLPRVGPVIINEVMYNPNGSGEFIEIFNLTNQFVPLHDPANPANTWRFVDGVDFAFPQNIRLAPYEMMLIVAQDPAQFRADFGIPATVRIFQYTGALDNSGESVRLSKPGAPDAATVPYISVDRVRYSNVAPWPIEPDGNGPSLSRLVKTTHGNEPTNWAASANNGGTPGAANQANNNPTINAGPDGSANTGSPFTGGGSFADVNAGQSWAVSVDWGDGSAPEIITANPDKSFSYSHTYIAPGTYTANFRVGDSEGGVGIDSVQVTVTGGVSSIEGTAGADTITVRSDAGGTNALIWVNVPTSGAPTYTLPISSLTTLTINGNAGNDSLTVDFVNGSPLPSGGIAWNGGTQTSPAGDSLAVIGSATHTFGHYKPTAGVTGSGIVTVGGRDISFSGLEPVTVSGFATFTFTTPSAGDSLTLDSFVTGQTRISGSSGGTGFESISFFDIPIFTLDAQTNDAGGGNDSVTISNGTPATGLVSLGLGLGTGANTVNVNGGTSLLNIFPPPAGGTVTVNVNNAAQLNFTDNNNILSSLNINGTATVRLLSGGAQRYISTGTLTIGPTATLDLADNDLLVKPTAATRDAVLGAINGWIRSGRAGGLWNGRGIISAAGANPARNTGLGAIFNDNGSGGVIYTTFNSQIADINAVMVKYTYDGDSNIDGDVDADDYARMDAAYARRNDVGFVANYRNGDFDYSGTVDQDDYFYIDRAFSTQGARLSGDVAEAPAASATVAPAPAVDPVAVEAAPPPAVTATKPVLTNATAPAKKHKHRRRPHVSNNMFVQQWKNPARY